MIFLHKFRGMLQFMFGEVMDLENCLTVTWRKNSLLGSIDCVLVE